MKTSPTNERFAALLQRFFLQRLMEQRNSSNQTIAEQLHKVARG